MDIGERELFNRILPIANNIGIPVLGTFAVPPAIEFTKHLNGKQWRIRRLAPHADIEAPPTVVQKINAFTSTRFVIDHWFIALDQPKGLDGQVLMTNVMLIGVVALPHEAGKGVWIKLGIWRDDHFQKETSKRRTDALYVYNESDDVISTALSVINNYHGQFVEVLGIEKVLTREMILEIDGFMWQVGPVSKIDRRKIKLPPDIQATFRAIEIDLRQVGLKFNFYMWGDIVKDHLLERRPRLVSYQGELMYLHPQQPLAPGMKCIYDPVLIGVIQHGEDEGLWVKLGAWLG